MSNENNNGFLPEGYEAPKQNSAYMSFEDGANKFLILSSALIGWQYWNLDGKPVRVKDEPENTPADIRRDKEGKPERVKHFWAFAVWNYEEEKVQILEITQSTIMRAVTALVQNDDWGTPIMTYPITITREGKDLTTKYNVTPSPAKPVPEEIKKEWAEVLEWGFDLKRLFEGGNPFTAETPEAKKK